MTAFDLLNNHGTVSSHWALTGSGEWTVQNFDNGQSGTIPESGRTDCCISLVTPDTETWTADLQSMQMTPIAVTIANVAR